MVRVPASLLICASADRNEAILARGSVAHRLARIIWPDISGLGALWAICGRPPDLNYWTVTVACMKGWIVQKYGNVPGVLNDRWYD